MSTPAAQLTPRWLQSFDCFVTLEDDGFRSDLKEARWIFTGLPDEFRKFVDVFFQGQVPLLNFDRHSAAGFPHCDDELIQRHGGVCTLLHFRTQRKVGQTVEDQADAILAQIFQPDAELTEFFQRFLTFGEKSVPRRLMGVPAKCNRRRFQRQVQTVDVATRQRLQFRINSFQQRFVVLDQILSLQRIY